MSRIQLYGGRSDNDFLNELQGGGVPIPRKGELVTTPNGTYRVAEVEHVFANHDAVTKVILDRVAT